MMKKLLIIIYFVYIACGLQAQQYSGTTGLIHVPTAEMNQEGDARLGGHFLNKEMLPDYRVFRFNDRKFHTFTHYLSITPFSWMEIAYTCTLFKTKENGSDVGGYGSKDRYFSLKLQPLREGKYWPAIAVGGNDFMDTRSNMKGEGGEIYFGNYYFAATKHVELKKTKIGVNVAYRHYLRSYNDRWAGIVGGITLRPTCYPNLRGIVEYNGEDINIGADCLLWRHLLMQVSLQGGKYISGGIAYQINLLGSKSTKK